MGAYVAIPASSDSAPFDDLVGGLVRGDEHALAAIYDRYAATLYTLAVAILREEADAEEVVTDVLMQLWRDPGSFDATRGSLGAFLTVMTRSRALDSLRSRRRRRRTEERAAHADEAGMATPISSPPPPPDSGALATELRGRVGGALDQLPEAQRRVIALAYFDGYTQSEIAAKLSEPLGTVKTRIRTAMARLRDILGGSDQGVAQ